MSRKQLSKGGANGPKAVKVMQPLTKTVKALNSTPEEMAITGWGKEQSFGPQSDRAVKRAELHPRKVPIGRGLAGNR